MNKSFNKIKQTNSSNEKNHECNIDYSFQFNEYEEKKIQICIRFQF